MHKVDVNTNKFYLDYDTSESNLEKKKRVIRKLVELEIAEDIAKAAVQCVIPLDEEECYYWAMENANNRTLIAESRRSFDEEMGELN